MDEIKIALLAEGQLLGYLGIIRESFQTVAEKLRLPEDNCLASGSFIRIGDLLGEYRAGVKMFGCLLDGKAVGFMQLAVPEPGRFILDKMSVLPDYRHRGIGAVLLTYAMEFSKKHGGQTLTVSVFEEDADTLRWYTDRGFRHTETIHTPSLPLAVAHMEMDLHHLTIGC